MNIHLGVFARMWLLRKLLMFIDYWLSLSLLTVRKTGCWKWAFIKLLSMTGLLQLTSDSITNNEIVCEPFLLFLIVTEIPNLCYFLVLHVWERMSTSKPCAHFCIMNFILQLQHSQLMWTPHAFGSCCICIFPMTLCAAMLCLNFALRCV